MATPHNKSQIHRGVLLPAHPLHLIHVCDEPHVTPVFQALYLKLVPLGVDQVPVDRVDAPAPQTDGQVSLGIAVRAAEGVAPALAAAAGRVVTEVA